METEPPDDQTSDIERIIPAEVQQFILGHIDSIAQLEALVLLRSTPDTWWPSSSVASRLYITEPHCREELEGLRRERLLLTREDEAGRFYRYRPETGELREMVDRLVYYYSKHLVPTSNLVHSKQRTRLHEFPKAFDLKRER
ncbi:MAG TPA: hypothetical protein VFS39_00425 [Nitrospira sp.]|nr:hypothetical protein [Nitrospira sp.]